MSGFIQGEARHQTTLFPEALDDYITEENPIRVIDAFVNSIDLANLGFKTLPADTGRPGYHPSTMLKLFIYGYLNRIQSSRRLERETGRNVELMWLLERLSPDFKTIADLRKDNSKGIKNTCRTFIELCRQMNMFTDTVVAIDDSKFKAVNNSKKNHTPSKVKFHTNRFEKHLAEYLKQLDDVDKKESQTIDDGVINDKITCLKERLIELKAMEEKVNRHPEKQLSTTDPDSRLMKTKGMSLLVCYNVQSAVDSKHQLVIAHEVTNKTDRGQLCRMGEQAQAALKEKEITVIADKGYYNGVDIKNCQDRGMSVLVPKGDTSASEKKGIFNRSMFTYDAKKDVYICPANKEMTYRFTSFEKGMNVKRYFLDVFTCRACHLKPQCTKSKQLPKMTRWEHQSK